MDSIAKLQLLIQADATSVSSVLNGVAKQIAATAKKVQGQPFDLRKMFATSFSPAVMATIGATIASGIAAGLGTALKDATEQIKELKTVLSDAGNNFKTMGAANQNSLSLVTKFGMSTTQANYAMGKFGSTMESVEATNEAISAAWKLSIITGQDFNAIVDQMNTTFDKFGKRTVTDVDDYLTGLVGTIGKGRFSIMELLDATNQLDGKLGTVTTLAGIVTGMQAISKETNLSKDTITGVTRSFSEMTGDITNVGGYLVDFGKTIGEDGLVGAFRKLADVSKSLPIAITADTFKIPQVAAQQLKDTSDIMFVKALEDSKTMVTSLDEVEKKVKDSTTSVDTLSQSWNRFKGELVKLGENLMPLLKVLSFALGLVTNLLQMVNVLVDSIKTMYGLLTGQQQNIHLGTESANSTPAMIGSPELKAGLEGSGGLKTPDFKNLAPHTGNAKLDSTLKEMNQIFNTYNVNQTVNGATGTSVESAAPIRGLQLGSQI